MFTRRIAHFVVEHSILLVAGTVVGLLWANLGHVSYERFAASAHFAVNDVGMVFFFALAAKEIIEAMLPGGALASLREAAVPLLAAAGGMIAPALIYSGGATLTGQPELLRGWAVPTATDIAFSYMAARMIFPPQHPGIPFLLLLAIADDALGLIILALFYPTREVSFVAFSLLIVPALAFAWMLRRRRVRNFWVYVCGSGSLSWAALFMGGFHPALALVPVIPFMPHHTRDLGFFDPREHGLPDTMNRFEAWWEVPVQIILFFFGLVNAGVPLASIGGATWLVLGALLTGKPLGILTFTMLGVALGLRVPGAMRYRDTLVVGVTAAIGFTVALFFATAAFPPGDVLDHAKMGALLSFAAAPLAIALGRGLGLRSPRTAPPQFRA